MQVLTIPFFLYKHVDKQYCVLVFGNSVPKVFKSSAINPNILSNSKVISNTIQQFTYRQKHLFLFDILLPFLLVFLLPLLNLRPRILNKFYKCLH